MARTPNPPSGLTTIRNALSAYGLEKLADWWWDRKKAGWTDAQLWLQVRQTRTFRNEFPEIEEREKAGLEALSPAQIVQYRGQVQQIGTAMGLSPQVLSKKVLQRLLIADKSPAEVERRLTRGFAEIVNAAPEIRETFQRWFGAQGDSAIAAIALDPELGAAEVERMAAAAQIGGIGGRFGFDFSEGRAMELAQAGVAGERISAGLGELDEQKPLFAETFSESTDLTAEREGTEAVFGLGSGDAIRKRREARIAAGSGGGSAAASGKGVIGLGAAE